MGSKGSKSSKDAESSSKTGEESKSADQRRLGTFTRQELERIDKVFNDLADRTPGTGTIAKADFLERFPMPGLMGERLFSTIDRDNTGVISKVNYLIAVRLLTKETAEAKVKLIFDMYDQDDSGNVSRKELTNMLVETAKSAFKIVERFKPTRTKEESDAELAEMLEVAAAMVDDAFKHFDTNSDSHLSFDQFHAWVASTPEVTHMLDAVMGEGGMRLLDPHPA